MKIDIKGITGNWDRGFVLDKHVLSSAYIGDNEYGRPQFDTTRSDVGESLFKLKYRNDWTQVIPLATQLAISVVPLFDKVELIVPMPASNIRSRQPVNEIAKELGKIINIPVFENIIIKAALNAGEKQLKDMATKEQKAAALMDRFSIKDSITNNGRWNALIIDDLFDTGASMEAACTVLRTYPKIKKIYVAALTWK